MKFYFQKFNIYGEIAKHETWFGASEILSLALKIPKNKYRNE